MIPIAMPVLGEAEAKAAHDAVLSGWVSQGPEVAAFESDFKAHVDAAHACAVSSCTTALHLALLAVGVATGDEVITASHSFIATANSIRFCGAVPVFVDIEEKGYNVDPECVSSAITPRTRAILAVHQMGMPCDLSALLAIADRHGLALIEDAACAIGSQVRISGGWQAIGQPHGQVACFSFHPRKVITTGDGGMLTTANGLLDAKFRLWRHQGMSVPDMVRHVSAQVIFEAYPVMGYNYRMSDIQAAVGRKQLARLPDLVARRRRLAERYAELLGNVEGLGLPVEPEWARSNWQSYCIRLPTWVEQKSVMQSLLDRGIATRRGIMCAHREPCYADRKQHHDLSRSELAQDRCILLPIYAQLTEGDQVEISQLLKRELQITSEKTRERRSPEEAPA
jgi:dTDP-4-amino-4,6-dideoxygalactose transaminase